MGGKSFSLFWDLKDGWYLHVEGRGEKKFGSQEEAEAVVLEELKKSRPKLERELERMNKVLEEIDGTKV